MLLGKLDHSGALAAGASRCHLVTICDTLANSLSCSSRVTLRSGGGGFIARTHLQGAGDTRCAHICRATRHAAEQRGGALTAAANNRVEANEVLKWVDHRIDKILYLGICKVLLLLLLRIGQVATNAICPALRW